MAFDLTTLLTDVFAPEPDEVVIVACDLPPRDEDDTPQWRERRLMAAEWQRAFAALGKARGFAVSPLLTYRATGSHGADLPDIGLSEGREVPLIETVLDGTLAAFLTEYSATAALDGLCKRKQDFRAASLPGVEKRMEKSALAADYREVARRCKILFDILDGAERLDVDFSTGHSCRFDLRHRRPEADDGYLPRDKRGDRVINLPSGETFIVPYEGELAGQPSNTEGHIPARFGKDAMVFQIARNRVTRVDGQSIAARDMRSFFAADPARANVAEVAFGCNDWARVTGNVLEDEKAGFHWAYGRSDHLGGTFGVDRFASPETVVHQDIVYARGNAIQVTRAAVVRGDERTTVIRNGSYVVF
jgi:hypothetical protein